MSQGLGCCAIIVVETVVVVVETVVVVVETVVVVMNKFSNNI